ncbi:hypothetical protein BGZ76_007647 [Entomortierella beljakovae]|nr:hypothetical protein BGZ76_007647 [Entomortierella beljakovae]
MKFANITKRYRKPSPQTISRDIELLEPVSVLSVQAAYEETQPLEISNHYDCIPQYHENEADFSGQGTSSQHHQQSYTNHGVITSPDQSCKLKGTTRSQEKRKRQSTQEIFDNMEQISSESCDSAVVSTDSAKPKAKRWAISMNTKRKFHELRKSGMSVKGASKEVGIGRTSGYSIDKNHNEGSSTDTGLNNAEKYRNGSPRNPSVEKIIDHWHTLTSRRGIYICEKKLRAQAFEIHRALPDDNSTRPPKFSTQWTVGFFKRYVRKINYHSYPSKGDLSTWRQLVIQLNLHMENKDDIFIFGVADMFLNMAPARKSTKADHKRFETHDDNSSASILMCCNHRGEKIPAHIHLRLDADTPEPQQYESNEVSLSTLSRTGVQEYLQGLDSRMKKLNRNIILFVSNAIWSAFLESERPKLQNIKIVSVPRGIDSLLPLDAVLMKEFKDSYHIKLANNCKEIKDNPRSYKLHLSLIRETWNGVSDKKIEESCGNFWKKVITGDEKFSIGQVNPENQILNLKSALKAAYGEEHEHYSHYLHHDGYTGLSCELWNMVHEYQKMSLKN